MLDVGLTIDILIDLEVSGSIELEPFFSHIDVLFLSILLLFQSNLYKEVPLKLMSIKEFVCLFVWV